MLEALAALAAFPLLPPEQKQLVAEAAEKLRGRVLYVVVLGDFKRGKSTLINALLDAPILPTGVVPVTAVSTLIRRSERPRVIAQGTAGEELFALEDLPKLVTEKGNPGNYRGLSDVIVEYPTQMLPDGIVLVDTPGLGSRHEHNTLMTRAFLPRVDAALVVLTVDSPLSAAEGRLLAEVAGITPAVAVCLNKADLLDRAQLSEAEEFVGAGLSEIVADRRIPLFPISARRHFADPQEENGLSAVRDWLETRVAGDRFAILYTRSRRVARSAHDIASSALQLERAGLLQPRQTAAEHQAEFEAERAALFLDARGATLQLQDAVQHIGKNIIEPAADRLREELPARLLAATETRADRADAAWPDVLRAAAHEWQVDAERRCAEELRVVPTRHLQRLQNRLDDFVAKAGQIFQISLPAALRLESTLELPPIRIAMIDEPGALEMSIRGVRQLLPGPLGARWREQARRKRAYEDADLLAGRLRYAASQGLEKSTREWAAAIDSGWKSLAEALSAAIGRSTAALAAGEAAVAEGRERLTSLEQQLGDISRCLGSQ